MDDCKSFYFLVLWQFSSKLAFSLTLVESSGLAVIEGTALVTLAAYRSQFSSIFFLKAALGSTYELFSILGAYPTAEVPKMSLSFLLYIQINQASISIDDLLPICQASQPYGRQIRDQESRVWEMLATNCPQFQRLFAQGLLAQIKLKVSGSMSTLEASPQLFNKDSFEVHEQIGRGQFGTVYRATHKASNTQIALKIISKEKITKVNFYNNLKREIEIQSRLKHKHICQLYAYFHDEENIYILLEYCKNGTIAVSVQERKEYFSDKKIASILQQLLYALAYMHERNVMHRDLKLQNILFDEGYNVKISDFGFCRHHLRTSLKKRNTFCGTMEYISPEMVSDRPYTDAIDVYCIGIILYELFYHTSPFIGKDDHQTFKNIQEKEIIFMDDVRIVPQEAKVLITRLLSKDPRDRPLARELFEDRFITKYLYGNQNSQEQKKRRMTEQCFLKWRQQIGIGVQTEDIQVQTDPKQPEQSQKETITPVAQPKHTEETVQEHRTFVEQPDYTQNNARESDKQPSSRKSSTASNQIVEYVAAQMVVGDE